MEQLSLREFIEKREAEIKGLMLNLKQELKELRAARAAVFDPPPLQGGLEAAESASGATQMTIKEMATQVLEAHGGSGTAEEIISWIKAEYEKSIARSSLSPQLSRLKRDGNLDLDATRGVWNLRDAAKSAGHEAASLDNAGHMPQTPPHDPIDER